MKRGVIIPERASGVLLHPASLPGPGCIGTVGAPARRFVEFLALARQSLWNILPLNPTGGDGCPYNSNSAFAGNPVLIDLDGLAPYCGAEVAAAVHTGDPRRVDHNLAISAAARAFAEAFESFRLHRRYEPDFEQFCEKEAFWLDDYALFCALRGYFGTPEWVRWSDEFRDREPGALKAFGVERADEILRHKFIQWVFFSQWHETRRLANEHGIAIIGDMPIFVSLASADVWSHQEIFQIADHRPVAVAGVPPDYFSPTGQLWGNPLYDWDAMARDGYTWWLRRVDTALKIYDVVRIDHFRGFDSYWAIPAGSPDATTGRWVKGPADAFFDAMRSHFGEIPLIAEDLGIITDEVHRLRERFGIPGMKVLQFAFVGGYDHPFLPANYTSPLCVVYTGTHDNDTTAGWFRTIPEGERRFALQYLGSPDGASIHWKMIGLAFSSIARYAIAPFQDLLGAGSEARLNTPGTVSDRNWSWRAVEGEFTPEVAGRLAALTESTGRIPRRDR